MSTSTALATEAHVEHIARCGLSMPKFDPKTATVVEMREYASCVQEIYGSGEPLSESVAFVLKILILSAAVGAMAGAIKGWIEDGVNAAAFGFFTGVIFAPIVAGLVFGVVWALS